MIIDYFLTLKTLWGMEREFQSASFEPNCNFLFVGEILKDKVKSYKDCWSNICLSHLWSYVHNLLTNQAKKSQRLKFWSISEELQNFKSFFFSRVVAGVFSGSSNSLSSPTIILWTPCLRPTEHPPKAGKIYGQTDGWMEVFPCSMRHRLLQAKGVISRNDEVSNVVDKELRMTNVSG